MSNPSADPHGAQSGAPLADDRREYFRIDDRIGLEIRPLPTGQVPENPTFDSDIGATLKAELRRHDLEFRQHLAVLAERDRTLTALLKALDSKLDALARIMALEQNPLQPEDWREVTLSEGGLSFECLTGQHGIGDCLAVRLTLPPDFLQAEGVVRVVSTEPGDAAGTAGFERLHTEFVRLADADRQSIARHVMRWQIRQRQTR